MLKQRNYGRALVPVMIAVLGLMVMAQEKSVTPDLSVVGIKLGNRASAKAFLGDFQARQGADGRLLFLQ